MLNFLQTLAKLEKPSVNLRDSLIASVKAVAEAAGLKASEYPNGWKIEGKEKAIVVVQFGGRREFYETMEMLEKDEADYRVIITSSNVRSMRIREIKWILLHKYQTKTKWLILDIEHKESPKTINFMLYSTKAKPRGEEVGEENYEHQQRKARRKKIFGKRREHKQQD